MTEQDDNVRRVGVLGAGAWGSALALVARRNGHDVTLFAREPEVVRTINDYQRNPRFLPCIDLDPAIRATEVAAKAVINAELVVVCVPAQFLRTGLASLASYWPPSAPAVLCTKGIEAHTMALPSQMMEEALPGIPYAVLSGPSFAIEVARDRPTALTIASKDPDIRQQVANTLGNRHFRLYDSDDVRGVEIGGAVKNVLAIACGIVAGRSLGENARAALITRGLAEMTRFAISLGARAETLMGLAGLGDLVLTATTSQSRNYSLGLFIGRGAPVAEALAANRGVIEGASTAAVLTELAERTGIDMPIATAVDRVLNHAADIDETIATLLARPFRSEG